MFVGPTLLFVDAPQELHEEKDLFRSFVCAVRREQEDAAFLHHVRSAAKVLSERSFTEDTLSFVVLGPTLSADRTYDW